jgi:hypothetical protein
VTRRAGTAAFAAVTLAGLLGGCGGGSSTPAAAASASPSPTTTNTVAGCQAAAVRAIVAGNLSDPEDGSGDYPECVGLSEAQLTVAAQGTMDDSAVKKAMADIVDKGLPGVEVTPGPVPTLPPDPMAGETPAPTP